jgi:hypothetical protein
MVGVFEIAAVRNGGRAIVAMLATAAGIADGVHAAASKELYSTKTTATIKARALRIRLF